MQLKMARHEVSLLQRETYEGTMRGINDLVVKEDLIPAVTVDRHIDDS